jgi:hypothetical protein
LAREAPRKAATIQPSAVRSPSVMPWSMASFARYGGASPVSVAARSETTARDVWSL